MSEMEIVYTNRVNGLERIIWKDLPFDCSIGQCKAMVRSEDYPDVFVQCPGYPTGSGKSHGIGQARYRWVIRGEGLGVQFVFSKGGPEEYLPETAERLALDGRFNPNNLGHWIPGIELTMAWDISWHSWFDPYEPFEIDGEIVSGSYSSNDCHVLPGMTCYYDGSSLNAEAYLHAFNNFGEDKVWEMLEQYFTETLEWMQSTLKNRS